MVVKKFRGVTAYDGRTIYGDLLHEARLTLILHDGFREVVKPESVAQLAWYDEFAHEYYEGDVIERGGKKYRVALEETLYETD